MDKLLQAGIDTQQNQEAGRMVAQPVAVMYMASLKTTETQMD